MALKKVKKGPETQYLYIKNDRKFSPEIWYTRFSYEHKLSYQKSAKSEVVGDIPYFSCLIWHGMTLLKVKLCYDFHFRDPIILMQFNESYYGECVRHLTTRSSEHIHISPLTNKRVEPRRHSAIYHH